MQLQKVYIVAAKRTPFGTFLGKLKDMNATELATHASRAALNQLNPSCLSDIDTCIFGNVCHTSRDAVYLARHVALYSNLRIETPCLTLNRLCGSGFQSAITAMQEIQLNKAKLALCGGTENMSLSPYVLRNVRRGTFFGMDLNLEDSLATALVDTINKENIPMAITAENLAMEYNITRRNCDEYALLSQQRWTSDEIAPVEIKTKKGIESIICDEHPKPNSSLEGLNKLKPVFKKEGVVTAGNASGISDGAAALVLANEDMIEKHKLSPLAEIIGYSVVGCQPRIMGIGPVYAIKKVLKETSLELKDIDYIELNEAFAAQFLAVNKNLNFNMEKTNVNGGAIAIGHPLGASGTRILAHLTYMLRNNKKELALGSACIGGGQGIAVVLRNCNK